MSTRSSAVGAATGREGGPRDTARRLRRWARVASGVAGVAAIASFSLLASADETFATYASGVVGGSGASSVDGAGNAAVSYPLVLPPGRGGIQPLLALHYSNNGGPSAVGVGWSLGLPSIERRGLAGGPPRLSSAT